MVYDRMDTGCAEDGESFNGAAVPPASFLSIPLLREMSLPDLAAQCLRELGNDRRGEPCTDEYGLELLRRATFQDNQEAWTWVQHCFDGIVRGWLRRQPQREVVCRLESEENYVAQTFERFWQATAVHQRIEFNTLAAALQYLHASLNGAILDTLRTYSRPREVLLPGEPQEEDQAASLELWENLQRELPSKREQRLAYLLYHCNLKPREIMSYCQEEWPDVQEIYRLRRNILERLLRQTDHLRRRFHLQELV
jgi:hypothetical protein